jgi:hypothetical protein
VSSIFIGEDLNEKHYQCLIKTLKEVNVIKHLSFYKPLNEGVFNLLLDFLKGNSVMETLEIVSGITSSGIEKLVKHFSGYTCEVLNSLILDHNSVGDSGARSLAV